MIYQKAKIENDTLVITESKEINQNELTSECWLIQFSGLSACKGCEVFNTPECGGKNIRKKLLKQKKESQKINNRKLFDAIYGKKGGRQCKQ